MSLPPHPGPAPSALMAPPLVVQLRDTVAVILPLAATAVQELLEHGPARFTEAAPPGVPAGARVSWRFVGGAPPLPAAEAGQAGLADLAALDRALGRPDPWAPLPVLTEQGADAVRVVWHVPEDLAWFEGHFPGHPILPGLAQLAWAGALARSLAPADAPPATLKQLKFKLPILPDHVVELRVRRLPGGGTAFVYRSATGEHSSGRFAPGGA